MKHLVQHQKKQKKKEEPIKEKNIGGGAIFNDDDDIFGSDGDNPLFNSMKPKFETKGEKDIKQEPIKEKTAHELFGDSSDDNEILPSSDNVKQTKEIEPPQKKQELEDKEKEKLDANSSKVKEIRDNLVSNNSNWRELIDTVSNDYDNATAEKNKLVSGLNETGNELKDLLDLVSKIPKRQILPKDDADAENNDNQQQEEEEPAAGGDDADGGD